MKLEDRLRVVLRPVDPGDGFAERVLVRLDVSSAAPVARVARVPSSAPRWALAACLLATVGGLVVHHQREQQREAAAAQQLTLALSLTSNRLDRLYHHLDFKTREMP